MSGPSLFSAVQRTATRPSPRLRALLMVSGMLVAPPACLSAADAGPAAPAVPVASPLDDSPTALRIAAAVIMEQAHAASQRGHPGIAAQLADLSKALLTHQVTLAEATSIARMVPAWTEAPPAAVAPTAAAATPVAQLAPDQVAAILDGGAPPTPTSAPVPASAPDPAAVSAPPPGAAPAATTPGVAPADASPQPPLIPHPLPPPPPPASPGTVLAVGPTGGDGRISVLMLDIGSRQHVAPGQRFAIRRGGRTIVEVIAHQVHAGETICVVLPTQAPHPELPIAGDIALPLQAP